MILKIGGKSFLGIGPQPILDGVEILFGARGAIFGVN